MKNPRKPDGSGVFSVVCECRRCNLTVLMPCQVLNCLRIHSGVDQVRDIRVAQQVRCCREIDSVDYTRLVPALLSELKSDLLLDGLTVHVFIECPFPGAAYLDVVPDPDELRIGKRLSFAVSDHVIRDRLHMV